MLIQKAQEADSDKELREREKMAKLNAVINAVENGGDELNEDNKIVKK